MAPYYSFVAADGSEETRDFFMEYADAIDIGAQVEIEGRKWTRLVSRHQALVKKFKPFVSHTQPVFESLEAAQRSGVVADAWVPDPDTGEYRAAYSKEQTAKENAAVSKDQSVHHLVWDE